MKYLQKGKAVYIGEQFHDGKDTDKDSTESILIGKSVRFIEDVTLNIRDYER